MIVEPDWADSLLRGLLLAFVALVWVVLLVRVVGLRSLSKMTPFDFVMTVALGSLVAGAAQAKDWLGFAQPLAGMAGLFLIQWVAARLRKHFDWFEQVIQNDPLLLMRDGEIIEDALIKGRVARSDLFAKLREANVLDMAQVRAVVLETTGDVSVLHGDHLEEQLIGGVRKANRA